MLMIIKETIKVTNSVEPNAYVTNKWMLRKKRTN